jgi:hypothetical protein
MAMGQIFAGQDIHRSCYQGRRKHNPLLYYKAKGHEQMPQVTKTSEADCILFFLFCEGVGKPTLVSPSSHSSAHGILQELVT